MRSSLVPYAVSFLINSLSLSLSLLLSSLSLPHSKGGGGKEGEF
jgi:hypothetical protein